ncbi:hypothetical protein FLAG1_10047 [Fusarium langsethiae]|uniref:Uncharacterized protein n=1 Tax=Fusarium langsethiae TaxID=179993 RepID=A0A0M9EPU7_FUSLA|nr:hypothetical protein FLAG1_10047 [Fusarium langsethiae]GKU06476.1 unnamed protein product [Fusarium langsethiae]GKU20477.1 unnamed protein product [Fusarium langsethiae]
MKVVTYMLVRIEQRNRRYKCRDCNEISHYEKLTPALDKIYGEGKVEWEIIGSLLKIASETKDVAESRERLHELGVTPTWEKFCRRELD